MSIDLGDSTSDGYASADDSGTDTHLDIAPYTPRHASVPDGEEERGGFLQRLVDEARSRSRNMPAVTESVERNSDSPEPTSTSPPRHPNEPDGEGERGGFLDRVVAEAREPLQGRRGSIPTDDPSDGSWGLHPGIGNVSVGPTAAQHRRVPTRAAPSIQPCVF